LNLVWCMLICTATRRPLSQRTAHSSGLFRALSSVEPHHLILPCPCTLPRARMTRIHCECLNGPLGVVEMYQEGGMHRWLPLPTTVLSSGAAVGGIGRAGKHDPCKQRHHAFLHPVTVVTITKQQLGSAFSAGHLSDRVAQSARQCFKGIRPGQP
jgi:hypothetical protein